MESLNDIIEERKKSRMNRHQHNFNYQHILQSTPMILRIQNSIDEEAVLIEKINMIQRNNEEGVSPAPSKAGSNSRPPSRIANDLPEGAHDEEVAEEETSNNGILKMSPRS